MPPTGTEIRPWTGAYLLIAFGALVLAAAAGVDGLAAELRDRSFGWQQPTSVIAGLLVVVTVLGAAGWWIWAGASGPIDRQRLDALPPYLQNAMLSDAGVRVLAIDLQHDGAPAGEAHYSVVFDDQLRLGDADRGFAFGGSTAAPDQVGDLVQRMVAGTADSDITPQLREPRHRVRLGDRCDHRGDRPDRQHAGPGHGQRQRDDHRLAAAAGRHPGHRGRGRADDGGRRAAAGGRRPAVAIAGSGSAKRPTRAGGPASTVSP